MKTEAEISTLWQMAHLKFHFGEELAMNAMFSPTTNVKCEVPLFQAVPASNDSLGESRKEPTSRRVSDLATEIA
ncbi:hypothetical protein AYO50_01760 [Acidobacteria bacterium SCGC AG-212-P17]|nr:hypothetical protein AYO50_01760 [Acidobacteria bacterium SCGC AG-212-P17]